MAAGARKPVYLVCMARPASRPARAARLSESRSLAHMKTARALKLRATAGTSSIRLRLGKKVGDRTVIQVNATSRPRAKRRNSAWRAKTKSRLNGKSQTFHQNGCSPNNRMASDHQYG